MFLTTSSTLVSPAVVALNGVKNKLNLGCGNKHLEDAINVDVTSATSPDVVWNLNRKPWPFANDKFAAVVALDVVEHLDDVVGTMEEIHRISRDGATVQISVPHFSCSNAFTDPTHRHYFGYFSFDYFTGEHEFSFYSSKRYRCCKRQMIFAPTLANKIVRRLAMRFPAAYERRWAWMFPAWFLYFELEVIKQR